MAIIGWDVVVPLALASTISGVVQSLGTNWGLVRHYWVAFKLIATLAATALLLLHMPLVDRLAGSAVSPAEFAALRHQLRFDSLAGLAVLAAISLLSFYKPRGVTPFGVRAP
jgi:hypothetical protein